MRARVAWHRREGHEIVIVSASLDVYLDPVARRTRRRARCCARASKSTPTVAAPDASSEGNCRGPEKAKRLQAYLGDGETVLWAYGDSSGDPEMLAMADHPVRVRRGRLRP